MNAIELRGLTKTFRIYRKEKGIAGAVKGLFHRKYTETKAFNEISFSIAEGTIILTSHYMQDIEALCDRAVLIDHGKVMFDGALDRIV